MDTVEIIKAVVFQSGSFWCGARSYGVVAH